MLGLMLVLMLGSKISENFKILEQLYNPTLNYGGVQGPKKWFAKCDKHYPSRSGQTSLAKAVANFTKPRTSHFFDLCRKANSGTHDMNM